MTIEKWFFLLITAIVLYLLLLILQPFILVLILAVVATIILSPIDRYVRKHLKHPRLSAAILSLGTFFLVFIPTVSILLLMVTQASELIKTSITDTSWIQQIEEVTTPLIQILPDPIQQELAAMDLGQTGKSIITWIFQNIGNVFSSSTKFILHTFLFFLCLYYLLVNREMLFEEMLALSPLKDETDKMLLRRIVNTVRGVVFGVLLVAIIQGTVAGIGMTIFGVPGSLILGALTAIAGLVPLVGTAIILIPAIVYLFLSGSTMAAIGLLIWSIACVSMIDNLIGPYLIGGRAHLHSFLVLISVLGGLTAFGSVGAIAGPTILAALLGLLELYKSGILTTGKLQK